MFGGIAVALWLLFVLGYCPRSNEAADALAAQQMANAKAAADALAAQKAAEAAKAAAMKKTTITCIKGKQVKTVTAIKPVCPAGYKRR